MASWCARLHSHWHGYDTTALVDRYYIQGISTDSQRDRVEPLPAASGHETAWRGTTRGIVWR